MKSRNAVRWVGGFLMAALLAAGAASEAFAAKTVKVGLFPFGPGRMVDDWILENGVHKKWGAKAGVDFKITHPRDDFAAFMGKSIDIVALSTLEIARLVGDEGHDIVMYGKQVDAFIDMYVRGDSKYKTPGDLKGKKIVHPGWDTGTAQMGVVLLKEWYGLDMKKDFKVVTAPWPVGPQLLAKGDVEMSLNLIPLSMNLWMGGKIRPVLATYASVWAQKRNTKHRLSITNFTGWENGCGAMRRLQGLGWERIPRDSGTRPKTRWLGRRSIGTASRRMPRTPRSSGSPSGCRSTVSYTKTRISIRPSLTRKPPF